MKKFFWMVAWIVLMGLILMACSSLPILRDVFPSTPTPDLESLVVPTAVQTTPTPEVDPSPSTTIRIWIPAQFLLPDGSTDGNLFQARLEEFSNRRSQLSIDLRVKELEGESGMLDSLRAAKNAAPLVVPDLVALPRPMMEAAYQEGLIIPLDEYTEIMGTQEWFDYALALSTYQDRLVGIPFAGDALVLAYKNDSDLEPPASWEELQAVQKPIAFPASDPHAVITFAFYDSLSSADAQSADTSNLDAQRMEKVLEFYQESQTSNVMPYWLTQFETEEQSWASYQERQSTLALTWTSDVYQSESLNTGLAAFPTEDGKPFTYATGWVWCVIGSNLEKENAAVELAEFLVEDPYLSSWTLESDYLPVRPQGFEDWPADENPMLFKQILPSAVLPPEGEVLQTLGPQVRDAVVAVLKDQGNPELVVEDLMSSLPGQ